ncbi:hypothetical protein BH18ACT4_BH18ACT4_06320 [soil metagenome]
MPPAVEPRSTFAGPWRPAGLDWPRAGLLLYVVVDEIVGSNVGLAVSPWPQLDELGRIRFGAATSPRMVEADRSELQAHLDRYRRPEILRGRLVRMGDAFAVAGADWPLPERLASDPASWMPPDIQDVTPQAREAARVSFFAAVAPVLSADRTPDRRVLALATPPPEPSAPGGPAPGPQE